MNNFNDLIFTGRGSNALWSILKAIDGKNKSILLPVNICEIVVGIILKLGMCPVFYDVNSKNGNANLALIKNAYRGNENILLAVHNFGIPIAIDEIKRWTAAQNIYLIEDVCNAIGATYKNKPLGNFGDAAIYSFGYAKIIENGVGGAMKIKNKHILNKAIEIMKALPVFNNLYREKDKYYQDKLKKLRKKKIYSITKLYNKYSDYLIFQLDKNNKQKIKKKLKKLNKNISRRNIIANYYRDNISNKAIITQPFVEGEVCWRYTILATNNDIRNKFVNKIRENNLLVSTWYPPVNNLFFPEQSPKKFPGAYEFGQRVLNLFVDERVTMKDVKKTVTLINSFS
ncbi:MAG: DegT/DnrJ/EryC1/StrS family aminotransferase [Bacteroidota bacterium]